MIVRRRRCKSEISATPYTASDTLELSFMLTPEFNQTVTVQPDGYITLRDAGDVPAAGRTLTEIHRIHQDCLFRESFMIL